jgi:alpha-tubulin suppressor-like RCC1 family protein
MLTLFSGSSYNITSCGSRVYYWNTTHMFGMGANYGGSLGTGFLTRTDTRCVGAQPINAFQNAGEEVLGLSCSSTTMMAWTKSGRVYGWGSNINKQLGPIVSSLSVPTLLSVASDPVVKVSVGQTHVLALTSAGQVYCWGVNKRGQCASQLSGDEVWPPLRVLVGSSPVVDVAAGAMHSLAVESIGNAFAWGFNHYGQACRTSNALRGETPSVYSVSPIQGQAFYGRPIRQIAATRDGSFFLNDEGRLFGCGSRSGMGFVDYQGVPTPSLYIDRPREILVLSPDALGSNVALSKVIASATSYHTIAVTSDLYLLGTGSNTAEELGLGNETLSVKTFVSLPQATKPIQSTSISGYQTIITSDSSITRPLSKVLRPQCEIQGCSCPAPLEDAICVNGKWTGPNIVIWTNTTVNTTIELTGNFTLAPSGSLTMPIGSALNVRGGCTQFFGGVVVITATQEQILQFAETPLYFINTTCTAGTPTVIVQVSGDADPCNRAEYQGVQRGPSGYFVLFKTITCEKKPLKLWIIGAVLGGIVGAVILALIIIFFIPKARLVVFPFYKRRMMAEEEDERRALNLGSPAESPNASAPNSEPNSARNSYQIV